MKFRPGFLVGLSFVTSTFKSHYPSYYALAAFSTADLLSSMVATGLPPPGTILQTVSTTQTRRE